MLLFCIGMANPLTVQVRDSPDGEIHDSGTSSSGGGHFLLYANRGTFAGRDLPALATPHLGFCLALELTAHVGEVLGVKPVLAGKSCGVAHLKLRTRAWPGALGALAAMQATDKTW
jgi:hypothetical protein